MEGAWGPALGGGGTLEGHRTHMSWGKRPRLQWWESSEGYKSSRKGQQLVACEKVSEFQIERVGGGVSEGEKKSVS